jgi:hypothetical protein
MCINTLHKGDSDYDDDDVNSSSSNNNNNNNKHSLSAIKNKYHVL